MKWVGDILQALKGFWLSLSVLATLLGILLIPIRLDGVLTAYPWMQGLMTREIALIAFAILCVGYIAWIDLRRLIPTWLRGKPIPIREAMALLYNRAGKDMREMAVMITGGAEQESPAEYFGFMLTTLHENGLVTLLGRRAPDLELEPLPRDYFDASTELKNGNARKVWASSPVDWHDLHVLRSEALKGLKEYEIDERRAEMHKRG